MTDPLFNLVIGDKNYSSWSLRPWLLMRMFDIPFSETHVVLRKPESRDAILEHSPSGKVPLLKGPDGPIWDSLAIAEYLSDLYPDRGLWPADTRLRAIARAVSCEMHSGFAPLCDQLPMDCNRSLTPPDLSDGTRQDIARIVAVWTHCLKAATDGPFLFGRFSVADAMYAPVTSRFRTYSIDLGAFGDDGTAQSYVDTLLDLPAMKTWFAEARAQLEERGELQ